MFSPLIFELYNRLSDPCIFSGALCCPLISACDVDNDSRMFVLNCYQFAGEGSLLAIRHIGNGFIDLFLQDLWNYLYDQKFVEVE